MHLFLGRETLKLETFGNRGIRIITVKAFLQRRSGLNAFLENIWLALVMQTVILSWKYKSARHYADYF